MYMGRLFFSCGSLCFLSSLSLAAAEGLPWEEAIGIDFGNSRSVYSLSIISYPNSVCCCDASKLANHGCSGKS